MKLKKIYVIMLAAGMIAIAVFLKGMSVLSGLRVETVAASAGMIEDYYTEEGNLRCGQDYTIVSKVSGPVADICVQENAEVKAGDILFIIDDRDILYQQALHESSVAGLTAQLEQSKINQLLTTSPQEYMNSLQRDRDAKAAQYQSAKTVYEASGTLYAAGDISRTDMEQSKAVYEAALAAWQQAIDRYQQSRVQFDQLAESGIDEQSINSKFYSSTIEALDAELEASRTSAEHVGKQLADCIVRADRTGIVTALPVKDVSMIQAGTPAVIINGFDKMQAEAEVLTSIAPYLTPGDPVLVTLKLRGEECTYEGTLSEVYHFAAKGTSALGLDEYRVQVKVELNDDPELQEMNGYDVNLRFRLYSEEDKLWIPASAVFRNNRQDYVFVANGNTAVKTPVELEYRTGTQAVIAAGIEPGDLVIVKADEEAVYDGVKIRK